MSAASRQPRSVFCSNFLTYASVLADNVVPVGEKADSQSSVERSHSAKKRRLVLFIMNYLSTVVLGVGLTGGQAWDALREI